MTGVFREVVVIKKKLDDVIHSEGPYFEQNQGHTLGLLRALEECEVTLGILQKSGICITLAKLRKKMKDKEVSSLVKKLIMTWKKILIVDDGGGCSSKKDNARSTRLNTHGDRSKGPLKKKCVIRPCKGPSKKKCVIRSCTIPAVPPPSKPAVPPPSKPAIISSKVVQRPPKRLTPSRSTLTPSAPTSVVNDKQLLSPHSSLTPSTNIGRTCGTEGYSAQREIKGMADAAAASEVVLNFPPNLGVLECMPSTGSEVRDRCREVIVKSLKKGVSQVSTEEEYKFYHLGCQIEESLFECFGDEGIKYKQRVRSRVSNLGDLKNPGLRQNVIAGHISPAKIAVMTPEEMASDSMKQLREQLTKEAIRDAMVAQTDGSGGSKCDLLRCPECSKNNCSYTQAQTLCSDEPMTTFAYCNVCGHRWFFY